MGISNEKLIDLLTTLLDQNQTNLAAILASNGKTVAAILSRDAQDHAHFRAEIKALCEQQTDADKAHALTQVQVDQHSENWSKVWKIVLVPIIGAVIVAVLALIGLGGILMPDYRTNITDVLQVMIDMTPPDAAIRPHLQAALDEITHLREIETAANELVDIILTDSREITLPTASSPIVKTIRRAQ